HVNPLLNGARSFVAPQVESAHKKNGRQKNRRRSESHTQRLSHVLRPRKVTERRQDPSQRCTEVWFTLTLSPRMNPEQHPTSNVQPRISNGSANPRSLRCSLFSPRFWV